MRSFFLFTLGRGFGLATLAAAAYVVKEALSPEGLQLEAALERVGQDDVGCRRSA